MKILITGAVGHLGSKFIHSIVPGEFDEIRMMDNMSCQRYVSLIFNTSRTKAMCFVVSLRLFCIKNLISALKHPD